MTTTKPAPAGCCQPRGIGQDTGNQVPDVETFAVHHGYELAASCTVSDSAWNNGGGAEHKTTLQKTPDDAHAGKFSVLVVWALDRIVREGAEDALRIVRQFRQRGCVEMPVRESWLNSAAAAWQPGSRAARGGGSAGRADMTTRKDRIAGVLLAQACGDALGTHYETGTPSHGHAQMLGGGSGFEPGEWSDDTQQACCVAMARSEPLAVAARLLEWYASHPKDIGQATRAVLSGCRTPGEVLAASKAYGGQMAARPKPRGLHPGLANGSLMRTGPVCLPFLGDRPAIAEAARAVSDLTHCDPYAGDACVLWSLAIDAAIVAGDDANAQSLMTAGLPYVPQARRGWWSQLIAQALRNRPAVYRMNGSAVGAFAAALSSVSRARSLPNGLQKAIQIGGDTDTVAAIAGSLLGAIYGASAVPDQWREAVWGWPGMKAADLEALALQAASSQVTP